MVHLLDEEDALDPSCPAGPISTPYTSKMIQDFHNDVASPTPSS